MIIIICSSGPWSKISEAAKELVSAMLTLDPEERITVDEALAHRWVREREYCAPKHHLQETVDELRKFNARRKLKGAVLAAVSSPKWSINSNDQQGLSIGGINGRSGGDRNSSLSNTNLNDDGRPSSAAAHASGLVTSSLDFGADDEVTSTAVGFVLDSLDDIHCLLEVKNRALRDQPEFLEPVLQDKPLHALLNLYDQISTTSYRPFRYPSSDATLKLNEALASIDAFFDQEDLADIGELRETLTQCHFRALLQVRYYQRYEHGSFY